MSRRTIFAWTLCGLSGCDVRHENRDFHVPGLRGMLVDQRRTSGGVAGPSHHPGRGGAELRGQGERGVPAVMEMEVAEPDLVPGGPPRPIHVVRPRWPPVGSGEDGGGRQAGSVGHQPGRGAGCRLTWCHEFYNTRRRHSSAAMMVPDSPRHPRFRCRRAGPGCRAPSMNAPNAKPVTSPSSGAPFARCLAGA